MDVQENYTDQQEPCRKRNRNTHGGIGVNHQHDNRSGNPKTQPCDRVTQRYKLYYDKNNEIAQIQIIPNRLAKQLTQTQQSE